MLLEKPYSDYLPISSGTHRQYREQKFQSIIAKVFGICAGLITLSLVFWLGRWSVSDDSPLLVSKITKTFQYDRNFSYPPSNTTDTFWKTLFPTDGGFFSRPPTIPARSTLSVFHQLHCLDAIRHAYWALHEAAIAGEQVNDEDIPMHTSPAHVRHCTDLIRQSLMCNADLTLEVKDEMGGVSGFGTARKCVDYGALIRSIEGWQHGEKWL